MQENRSLADGRETRRRGPGEERLQACPVPAVEYVLLARHEQRPGEALDGFAPKRQADEKRLHVRIAHPWRWDELGLEDHWKSFIRLLRNLRGCVD